MVPSFPSCDSHAHLRPAVACVRRSVQLQPNEVAAERRRSEEEGARPLDLQDLILSVLKFVLGLS